MVNDGRITAAVDPLRKQRPLQVRGRRSKATWTER